MNPNISNNNQTASDVVLGGVGDVAGNGNISIVPGAVDGDVSSPGGSGGAAVGGGGATPAVVGGDVAGSSVVVGVPAVAGGDIGLLPAVANVVNNGPPAPAIIPGAPGSGFGAGFAAPGVGLAAQGSSTAQGAGFSAPGVGVAAQGGSTAPGAQGGSAVGFVAPSVGVAAQGGFSAPGVGFAVPGVGLAVQGGVGYAAPGVGVGVAPGGGVAEPAAPGIGVAAAVAPEGHHVFQIPYFDLCYSSGDEEKNPPIVRNVKIKIEPGTEQRATQAMGLSHSQHIQPPDDDEEKDDEEEEDEERVPRDQQVFRIGEGIILDGIYRPNTKRSKDDFRLEELVFFTTL